MDKHIPLPKHLTRSIIIPFIEHEKYLYTCAHRIVNIQQLNHKEGQAYSFKSFCKGCFFSSTVLDMNNEGEYPRKILGTRYKIISYFEGTYRCEIINKDELTEDEKRIAQILGIL